MENSTKNDIDKEEIKSALFEIVNNIPNFNDEKKYYNQDFSYYYKD